MNTVYPSEMSVGLIETYAPGASTGGDFPKNLIPLARVGDEQDMAGNILYLASRAGAYLNGVEILTDGGRLTTFPSTN